MALPTMRSHSSWKEVSVGHSPSAPSLVCTKVGPHFSRSSKERAVFHNSHLDDLHNVAVDALVTKAEMVDFAVKTYLHLWQLIKENLCAPSHSMWSGRFDMNDACCGETVDYPHIEPKSEVRFDMNDAFCGDFL